MTEPSRPGTAERPRRVRFWLEPTGTLLMKSEVNDTFPRARLQVGRNTKGNFAFNLLLDDGGASKSDDPARIGRFQRDGDGIPALFEWIRQEKVLGKLFRNNRIIKSHLTAQQYVSERIRQWLFIDGQIPYHEWIGNDGKISFPLEDLVGAQEAAD